MNAVHIVPASDGVFEIFVNEKRVFSKQSLGRFPMEDEAEQLIADEM